MAMLVIDYFRMHIKFDFKEISHVLLYKSGYNGNSIKKNKRQAQLTYNWFFMVQHEISLQPLTLSESFLWFIIRKTSSTFLAHNYVLNPDYMRLQHYRWSFIWNYRDERLLYVSQTVIMFFYSRKFLTVSQ